MSYLLTPEAEAELRDAAAFYAREISPATAIKFLTVFEEKASLISRFPGLGTPTSKGRKLFPVGRFSYSFLYRDEGGNIRISAVAHHSRRPGYWDGRV